MKTMIMVVLHIDISIILSLVMTSHLWLNNYFSHPLIPKDITILIQKRKKSFLYTFHSRSGSKCARAIFSPRFYVYIKVKTRVVVSEKTITDKIREGNFGYSFI